MPIPQEQFIESTPDTKDRLVDAAGRLFADLGYTAVSLREIAAEANVHFSLVNYHFGNKKELYRAALEKAISCPADQAQKEAVLTLEDPVERMMVIAKHILNGYKPGNNPRWYSKLLINELQSDNPDWELVSSYWGPGADAIQKSIVEIRGSNENDTANRMSAIAFFVLIDTMGEHSHHFTNDNPLWARDAISTDELAEHLVNLFVNGVAGRPDIA